MKLLAWMQWHFTCSLYISLFSDLEFSIASTPRTSERFQSLRLCLFNSSKLIPPETLECLFHMAYHIRCFRGRKDEFNMDSVPKNLTGGLVEELSCPHLLGWNRGDNGDYCMRGILRPHESWVLGVEVRKGFEERGLFKLSFEKKSEFGHVDFMGGSFIKFAWQHVDAQQKQLDCPKSFPAWVGASHPHSNPPK